MRSSRSVPMLIADTSPLVAMLNAKDKHHRRAPRCSGGSAVRSSPRPPSSLRSPTSSGSSRVPSSRPRSSTRGHVASWSSRRPPCRTSPGWPTWWGCTRTLHSGPPGPLRGLRAAVGPPQVHARARGTAALLAAQKGPALPVLPATPGHWPPARRPRKNMAANTRLCLSLQHKTCPIRAGDATWSRPI
jgi:hypothetical protein